MQWNWPWVLVFVCCGDWFDFMFSLWCVDWVGGLFANRVFVYFCSGGGVGAWGGVGCLWGCFGPPDVLLCWPFWGGGPGVGLALWCFVVYSARRFVICLTLCHFVLVFFSPFSIAITSLGEERSNLSAFRVFDRFVLGGFVGFLFLLVSGKGCSLWL